MKRTLALAAAACTLAIPVIATGQTSVGLFNGHLTESPDSAVSLKFNQAVYDTRVRVFAVHDLTVTCDDGVVATLDHAKLKGKGKKGGVRVGDGGNFRRKDNNHKTVLTVSGHIGQNKAFGGFRLTGKITGTDNVVRECDSGKLSWVARPPKS
jgi:hypothetical protein